MFTHNISYYDYFKSKGLDGDKIDAAVISCDELDVIINGDHSNWAACGLRENKSTYRQYYGFVKV